MKLFGLIALFLLLLSTSCQKEVIVPIQENDEFMETRGSSRNPGDCGGDDSGGITDPDDESEEDKIRNKKRKAK